MHGNRATRPRAGKRFGRRNRWLLTGVNSRSFPALLASVPFRREPFAALLATRYNDGHATRTYPIRLGASPTANRLRTAADEGDRFRHDRRLRRPVGSRR